MKKKSKAYYLEILSLSEDFNSSELKKAYRREAKKWHPDLNKEKILAEERIKLINEAYEFLIAFKRKKTNVEKTSTTSYTNQKEATKDKSSNTSYTNQKDATKEKTSNTSYTKNKKSTQEKSSRFFAEIVGSIPTIIVVSIVLFNRILWTTYSPPKYYTDSIKKALLQGIKECLIRYEEKKSTEFADSQFFSSKNYEGYYISKLESINDSNSCFQAQAFPEIRFQNKLTRFDVELNIKTGRFSKTCDDPSKYGCEEGNTW